MANLIQNTLEITKIVIDSDMPRLIPLCVLHLPSLTYRASIVRLSCRAEPNPTGPDPLAVPAPSNRPFRDKAEDAIILFHILIEAVLQEPHFFQEHSFTFIVHRSALLAHTPDAHRACPPFFSSPELAPSQVPWAAWGITETRWFNGNSASMDWITTMAGQRSVTMEDGTSMPITVRDFNPYAVRVARALATASGQRKQGNWSKQLPNGNRMTLQAEDSVISAGSVFKEDLRSSLPYTEIVTQAEYRYVGVLIDDERILGMKVRSLRIYVVIHVLVVLTFHFLQTSQDSPWISSFDVHVLG
jgi:hypothetical protein